MTRPTCVEEVETSLLEQWLAAYETCKAQGLVAGTGEHAAKRAAVYESELLRRLTLGSLEPTS